MSRPLTVLAKALNTVWVCNLDAIDTKLSWTVSTNAL